MNTKEKIIVLCILIVISVFSVFLILNTPFFKPNYFGETEQGRMMTECRLELRQYCNMEPQTFPEDWNIKKMESKYGSKYSCYELVECTSCDDCGYGTLWS